MLRLTAAILALPKPAVLKALAAAFVTRYLFNDWEFLAFLMIFVTLDTLTGIIAALKTGTLHSSKVKPFFYKVFVYGVVLIMTHVLTSFKIHEKVNLVFQFFDALAYTLMMGREAISILENIAKIDPELLPAPMLARLKDAVTGILNSLVNVFAARAKANAQAALELPATEPTTEPEAPAEPSTEPAPEQAAG